MSKHWQTILTVFWLFKKQMPHQIVCWKSVYFKGSNTGSDLWYLILSVIAFASWKWNTKGFLFYFFLCPANEWIPIQRVNSLFCFEKDIILWSSILKANGNFYISVTQKKILWSPPTAHNGRVLCHVNPDPTAAVPVRMGLKRERKKEKYQYRLPCTPHIPSCMNKFSLM